jgi:hypothetical protein
MRVSLKRRIFKNTGMKEKKRNAGKFLLWVLDAKESVPSKRYKGKFP